MAKESKSKILRNTFFKVYEGLSTEYRNKTSFQEFYEKEMNIIISNTKDKLG